MLGNEALHATMKDTFSLYMYPVFYFFRCKSRDMLAENWPFSLTSRIYYARYKGAVSRKLSKFKPSELPPKRSKKKRNVRKKRSKHCKKVPITANTKGGMDGQHAED